MNHETKEQAAREYVKDTWVMSDEGCNISDLVMDYEKEAFIAGASWREQQAASGFEEHWKGERWDRYFDRYSPQYTQSERAWQEAQLSSAKLLAEKDAEIERLKEILDTINKRGEE